VDLLLLQSVIVCILDLNRKFFLKWLDFFSQMNYSVNYFFYPVGYTQLDDRRILVETNESFVNMKFKLQGSAIDIRWQPGGLLRMGGKHFQPFS
jgi:hypothetical protein